MKPRGKEVGLLPGKSRARWGAGVALGILGIGLLFGTTVVFTVIPGAVPSITYLFVLGTALALILVAYALVR